MKVFKFFEHHGLCKGRITSYDKINKYWPIKYDIDATTEDWDKNDMIQYVVEEKDIHTHSIGAHRDPINLPTNSSEEESDDGYKTPKTGSTHLGGEPEPEYMRGMGRKENPTSPIEQKGFYKGNTLEPWSKWKNKKVSLILSKLRKHGIIVPKGYDRANGKLQKLWEKWMDCDNFITDEEELWDDESSSSNHSAIHKTNKKPTHPSRHEDNYMENAVSKVNMIDQEIARLQLSRKKAAAQRKAADELRRKDDRITSTTSSADNPVDLTHTSSENTSTTSIKICQLHGCSEPCFTEDDGTTYDYCHRTHAREAGAYPEQDVQPSAKATLGVSTNTQMIPKRRRNTHKSKNRTVKEPTKSDDDRKTTHHNMGATTMSSPYTRPDTPAMRATTLSENDTPSSVFTASYREGSSDEEYPSGPSGPLGLDGEENKELVNGAKMPRYLRNIEDNHYYTTPKHQRMTFNELCDKMNINRTADRSTYYHWLGPTFGTEGIDRSPWDLHEDPHLPIYGAKFSTPWGVKTPIKRNKRLLIRGGSTFPRPSGPEWDRLTTINDNRSEIDDLNKANAKAIKQVMQVQQTSNAMYTKLGRITTELPDKIDQQQMIMVEEELHELDCHAYRTSVTPNETRQDIIRRFFESTDKPNTINGGIIHPLTGKIIAPQDFQKIFTRTDREKWMEAVIKELDAFDKREAILHDLTAQEIKDMGITHTPVPMRLIFDVKYLPDGTFQKFKARQVVQGHKKYMRFGEHFHTTFAPAPTLATNRLLQAVITHKRLHRVVFDICTAYLWAPAPQHERIPLRYPVGLRRYHPQTGEELMGVLLKMIYGCPQSAFRWAEHRQNWMERHFKNTLKWGYHQARQDPCLTMLTSPNGEIAYVVSHVDDIELAGANLKDLKFIEDQYRKEFEITAGNPRFMLGIQRDMEEVNNVTSIHLTQPDFLVETYKLYEDKMKKAVPTTPMPVGEFLYLGQDASSDQEHKHYLTEGFQNIAGACLWGARNCFPECMYGTAQVCRLMSKPNKRAWECACRILQYMYNKRTTGIRFRADGCPYLQCYYDSSHKADPTDGKAQYGWVITFMNGPVEWNSKKHNHVGISSSHNEYMALSHATKAVMWIRQLLVEMQLQEYIPEPTPMLGDNDQATLLSQQEMVTNGNKFYLLDYHYSREAVKEGHTSTRRVDTKANYSDMFTKAVPKIDLERLGETLKGNNGVHQVTPPPKAE